VPNPRRELAVFPVLLQALPIPYVRLKFEKPALDLSAIRHSARSHNVNVSNITLTYIGVVNALAVRSPHSLERCGTTAPSRKELQAQSNGPDGEGLKDQTLHEPYRTERKLGD